MTLCNRTRILNIITQFPGIHFREIKRQTGLGTGTVEYHIYGLEKTKKIVSEKIRSTKCLYPATMEKNNRIHSGLMRQKTTRSIMIALLQEPKSHKELVEELSIVPSCVTWHMKTLRMYEVVHVEKKGHRHYYQLKNKDDVLQALNMFQPTVTDAVVDAFSKAWWWK